VSSLSNDPDLQKINVFYSLGTDMIEISIAKKKKDNPKKIEEKILF